jgi:hypothetical protein
MQRLVVVGLALGLVVATSQNATAAQATGTVINEYSIPTGAVSMVDRRLAWTWSSRSRGDHNVNPGTLDMPCAELDASLTLVGRHVVLRKQRRWTRWAVPTYGVASITRDVVASALPA